MGKAVFARKIGNRSHSYTPSSAFHLVHAERLGETLFVWNELGKIFGYKHRHLKLSCEAFEPEGEIHGVANQSELTVAHAAVGDFAGMESDADFKIKIRTGKDFRMVVGDAITACE